MKSKATAEEIKQKKIKTALDLLVEISIRILSEKAARISSPNKE